jgi:hypothetical protein
VKNGNRRVKVSAGQLELAAELGVTKIIAFYALLASLRALEGDTRGGAAGCRYGVARGTGHLKLEVDAPLLDVSRVAFDVNGRPVELCISRCDTTRTRYAADVQ